MNWHFLNELIWMLSVSKLSEPHSQFKWLCEGETVLNSGVIWFPSVYVDFSSVQITFPVSDFLSRTFSSMNLFWECSWTSIRFWMLGWTFTQNLKTVILLVFPLRVFIKDCWFCVILCRELWYHIIISIFVFV